MNKKAYEEWKSTVISSNSQIQTGMYFLYSSSSLISKADDSLDCHYPFKKKLFHQSTPLFEMKFT